MKSTKFIAAITISLFTLGLAATKTHAAADANATAGVQNEINYITSLHDQGMTLSVQTVGNPWHVDDLAAYSSGESEITRVYQMTGKYPAVCDDDFLNCNDYSDHGASVINLAKNYAAAGGLNAFEWHEGNPRSYDPDAMTFYVGGSNPAPLSSSEWNDLLNNSGSTMHQNWQHHMDLLAGWLGQLQTAGVTVLWRPYHEGDGSWFWWGGNAANYVALYRMEFNYLTGTKGIHNCIWMTSSPSSSGYYPGVNYVDIGGMDIYSSTQTDSSYQNTTNTLNSYQIAGPIALTECGLLPDTNLIHTCGYAFVNVWCGGFLDPGYYGATGGTNNTLQQVQNFYNDSRTVNRDQVAVPTPAVSTNIWYNIVDQNSGEVLGVNGMSTADGASVVQWTNNGTSDHNWKFVPNGNGSYRIINQNSNKALGIAGMGQGLGNQAVQWTDNGGVDHNWNLVSQGNGQFHLVNQYSGLVLGISGASTSPGANAVQWNDNGTSDHNFAFVPIGSPLASGHGYHIVNSHSGLFIDNPNGTNVPGTWLQQFINTYSTAQQWTATNVSGDLWTFVNQGGGLAIDDYGWSTSPGQRVDEWTYGGAAVQQYHVVAVGDGTYKMVSAVSNLPLEIAGASRGNGGVFQQWTDNGNACQHWIFQYVN